MLNKITLMGRLTRDPELRYTKNETPVASFTLAVDRDMDGVDFIDCVAWRKTAEFANTYFRKGEMAVVAGRLQIREYEKDGSKRKAAEVVVDNLYFGQPRTQKPTQNLVELDDEEGLPF